MLPAAALPARQGADAAAVPAPLPARYGADAATVSAALPARQGADAAAVAATLPARQGADAARSTNATAAATAARRADLRTDRVQQQYSGCIELLGNDAVLVFKGTRMRRVFGPQ